MPHHTTQVLSCEQKSKAIDCTETGLSPPQVVSMWVLGCSMPTLQGSYSNKGNMKESVRVGQQIGDAAL